MNRSTRPCGYCLGVTWTPVGCTRTPRCRLAGREHTFCAQFARFCQTFRKLLVKDKTLLAISQSLSCWQGGQGAVFGLPVMERRGTRDASVAGTEFLMNLFRLAELGESARVLLLAFCARVSLVLLELGRAECLKRGVE